MSAASKSGRVVPSYFFCGVAQQIVKSGDRKLLLYGVWIFTSRYKKFTQSRAYASFDRCFEKLALQVLLHLLEARLLPS
jgi:hypothetical protein